MMPEERGRTDAMPKKSYRKAQVYPVYNFTFTYSKGHSRQALVAPEASPANKIFDCRPNVNGIGVSMNVFPVQFAHSVS